MRIELGRMFEREKWITVEFLAILSTERAPDQGHPFLRSGSLF
jgi:hypothetical protein